MRVQCFEYLTLNETNSGLSQKSTANKHKKGLDKVQRKYRFQNPTPKCTAATAAIAIVECGTKSSEKGKSARFTLFDDFGS